MIFKLVGCAVLLSFLAFTLREFGFKGAPVFAVASGVLLLGLVASRLEETLFFGGALFLSETGGEILGVALKALGISYLFSIASEVCTSLGEGGIARALDVAGRVELVILIMPYVIKIIELGREMLV